MTLRVWLVRLSRDPGWLQLRRVAYRGEDAHRLSSLSVQSDQARGVCLRPAPGIAHRGHGCAKPGTAIKLCDAFGMSMVELLLLRDV